MAAGRETEFNWRGSAWRKIIITRKINTKMTLPVSIFKVAQKIGCVGKYIWVEKMAFMSMPSLYFHEAQISLNDNFSVIFQGIFLSLITF